MRGWKERSFTAEKTDSHYFLAWQSKLTATATNHVHTWTPSIWWDENGSSPPWASSPRKFWLEGHSTKHLTNSPQNCQGHQKQGKPERPSRPRGGWGDLTTECDLVSWAGSRNRGSVVGNHSGNPNRMCLVNGAVPTLIPWLWQVCHAN